MSTQGKPTSDSLPVSASCSESPAVARVKKYDKISYETRKELIKRVLKRGEKIAEVSVELGIKLSTSKFIIKSFKRYGRIFRKKSVGEPQQQRQAEAPHQLQPSVEQPPQPPASESNRLTLVYYPVFVYQPLHWNPEIAVGCMPNWQQLPSPAMTLPYL